MNKISPKVAMRLANFALLIIFACLLLGSFKIPGEMKFSLSKDSNQMRHFFANASYYIFVFLMVLWSVQGILLLKKINFSFKNLLKNYWPGFVAALLLCIIVFVSVPVTFKTLSDETNLIAISNSLANDKTPFNTTMGKHYYDNFNPTNFEIPKRPLVFPFLVSLMHTLTGVRYQNAFILNFISLFLFLSGIFIVVRKRTDLPSAIAAMLLILAYPVVTIFATSGGFDFINAAFFFLVLAAGCYCIHNPSSTAFGFLGASLLVFANIRYEGAIFLVVVPLLMLAAAKFKHIKNNAHLIFAAPIVMLPYLWQRLLKPDAYQTGEDEKLFSLTAFGTNLRDFFVNLIDLDYYLPYAGIVTIIGLLLVVLVAVLICTRKISLNRNHTYAAIFVFLTILISTLLFFAHFFGVYTHPSSARFFIILSIAMALMPVVVRIWIPQKINSIALLVAAAAFFAVYHPIAVEHRFINALMGNRMTWQCTNFLEKLDTKDVLIIAERPGQFTAQGYGTVNFEHARRRDPQGNLETLKEIRRRLAARTFTFQEIEYETMQPTDNTKLPKEYDLKTLYEIQISATEFLRISEIVTEAAGT